MDLAAVRRQPRLSNSPLKIALVQLRYPKQIGIAESDVRPIQRSLSELYPVANTGATNEIMITPSGPVTTGDPQRVWQFTSIDGHWTVTLGPDALSLETTAYIDVVDFLDRWQTIVPVVVDAFSISHQERIGVRYVNQMKASAPMTHDDLSATVRPELIGVVGAHPRAQRLFSSLNEVRLEQERGFCTLRNGLIRGAGDDATYVLDMDFYDETNSALDLERQFQTVAAFADGAYELFKWAIAPERFASFGPEGQDDA